MPSGLKPLACHSVTDSDARPPHCACTTQPHTCTLAQHTAHTTHHTPHTHHTHRDTRPQGGLGGWAPSAHNAHWQWLRRTYVTVFPQPCHSLAATDSDALCIYSSAHMYTAHTVTRDPRVGWVAGLRVPTTPTGYAELTVTVLSDRCTVLRVTLYIHTGSSTHVYTLASLTHTTHKL